MTIPDFNPYASPKALSLLRTPGMNDESSLVRITLVAILSFITQFLAYSSIDVFGAFVMNERTLRVNAWIAGWGCVGALTKGRVESLVIPAVVFVCPVFADLLRGSTSIDLVKAIGAVIASRLSQQLATGGTKLPWSAPRSVRNLEDPLTVVIRSSLVSTLIGAICGVILFAVTLLQVGVWMTLADALCLYAAMGALGARSRNLALTGVWLLLCYSPALRFASWIDTVVYTGVAWLAILAGRGGTLILRSVDRREQPT